MHSTASSLTLPALTNSQRQQLLEQANMCSLYELFTTIPDPRRKEGQRYELPYLLTCLVAGLLCNCNSTLAVGQWCREHRVLLARLFGPRRFLCPCDSLYRYLLPRISAEHLEWALADWMRATLVAEADESIALDGKSIRGARTGAQKAPHHLSFCTNHSQEILRAACAWTRKPMRFPSLSNCCRVCRWLDASIPPMPCIPRWTSWPWYAPGRVMSC